MGLQYIWQNKDWYNFKWDKEIVLELLARARFVQGGLLSRVGDLALTLGLEAQAEILVEETLKTSEIKGNIFSRDSVRSSVAEHLGIQYVGLVPKKDRNIDALVELLIDATLNYSTPLTRKRLDSWHAALFPTGYSGMHEINAGNIRNRDVSVVSGYVGREIVHFKAPPANVLDSELKYFLDWWKNNVNDLDGIILAAIVHLWFVTLHPYDDGNGRLARALTDMALAQDEKLNVRYYSMSSQIMRQREEYYNVLEYTQKHGSDITKWLTWFLQCFISAVENAENIISNILFKSRFWNIFAQTQMNAKQRKVINRLLDAGKGNFKGNLNTRKYMGMTKTSRATAYRDITDLVKKNVLVKLSGKGRSVCYDLNWELIIKA